MYDKVSVNPSKYGLRSHLWKIFWKDWGLCKEHINHIVRNFIIIIIIIFSQSQRDIIWSCDLKGGTGIWRTLAKMFTFRRNCSCSSGHRASSLCMGNCWKHPNCLAQLLHNNACCQVTCLKCFLYMCKWHLTLPNFNEQWVVPQEWPEWTPIARPQRIPKVKPSTRPKVVSEKTLHQRLVHITLGGNFVHLRINCKWWNIMQLHDFWGQFRHFWRSKFHWSLKWCIQTPFSTPANHPRWCYAQYPASSGTVNLQRSPSKKARSIFKVS